MQQIFKKVFGFRTNISDNSVRKMKSKISLEYLSAALSNKIIMPKGSTSDVISQMELLVYDFLKFEQIRNANMT